MINPKELRIGNIVWQGELYKESIVTSYELNQFSDYNRGVTNLSEYYKEWKPIPLTEEWLVNFGFENKGVFVNKLIISGSSSGDMDGAILFQSKSANVYFINRVFHYEISRSDDDYGDHYYTKKIEYVHQLQNLYFALTGEELTIK